MHSHSESRCAMLDDEPEDDENEVGNQKDEC